MRLALRFRRLTRLCCNAIPASDCSAQDSAWGFATLTRGKNQPDFPSPFSQTAAGASALAEPSPVEAHLAGRATRTATSAHKRCVACKVVKPASDFNVHARSQDGLCHRCIACAVTARAVKPPKDPVALEKRCPRCSTTKPASEFNRNNADPSGLQSFCRVCSNAAAKQHTAKVLKHNREMGRPAVQRQQCNKCGEWKPAEEFFRDLCALSGLRGDCIDCRKKSQAERYTILGARKRADEKLCRGCGELKSSKEFYVTNTTADGLLSRCKPCYKYYREQMKLQIEARAAKITSSLDVAAVV